MTVPPEWQGLWRRLALERPDGSGDTASLVLWLQTGTLYADIRLPPHRPDFTGVGGFADLTFAQTTYLAAQEGFAGALHARGRRAHWRRRIDFAPLAGPPDEGRLVRSRRMLVETGVHADYVEHWWQEDPAGAADTGVLHDTARCIAVRSGRHLLIAVDRRPAPPRPGGLADAVAAASPGGLAALLDCEVSLAAREPDGWRITHSTLPWREGRLVDPARDLHACGQASD